MGTSSGMKRFLTTSLLPVTLVLLAFGGTLAAEPALTVANHLQLPLTLVHLPGCCSPCGWTDPPPELQCSVLRCVRCPNLVVDAGAVVTLRNKVGPYPLPFLKIQVEQVVYCVADEDLKLITASVTLTVGPEKCGPGLQAFVYGDVQKSPMAKLCLPLCPVKDS